MYRELKKLYLYSYSYKSKNYTPSHIHIGQKVILTAIHTGVKKKIYIGLYSTYKGLQHIYSGLYIQV